MKQQLGGGGGGGGAAGGEAGVAVADWDADATCPACGQVQSASCRVLFNAKPACPHQLCYACMLIISIPAGDAQPECPLCPAGHGQFTHIRSEGKRATAKAEEVFPHGVSKAGACNRCRNALGGIDVYSHRGGNCPLSLEAAGEIQYSNMPTTSIITLERTGN